MFIAIVRHTPFWVWGLLTALLVLGISQTRHREMSLTRVTVLPLVLLGVSLAGVFSAFGLSPVAFCSWAVGVVTVLAVGRRAIAVRGAAWSMPTRTLHVPGSWLPLVLIVGLFAVKYATGVTLAMHPARAADPLFAGLASLAYGSFSGLFMARAMTLRRLATRAPLMRAA